MQIIKTDHLDNLDNLDNLDILDHLDHLEHLDHLDHHEHLNHLEHLEHLDNLNHLSHPNQPDHPDHLDLNDLPNQVSYNPDHQKIYQEDNYRICIAYFVLFQIILIYVQVSLSITVLEQCSDAVYAIFRAGCIIFLPVNAKTMLFCIL